MVDRGAPPSVAVGGLSRVTPPRRTHRSRSSRADVNGVRISDTEAAALVSASSCRVTFSAAGAQSKTAQCMKYDAPNHQFLYQWALAKKPNGTATITVTVGYPGTTTTTTKSATITITI
jgi:hypothetical protein